MRPVIPVSRETLEEIDNHREQEESYDEFLRELLNIYEQQGTFTREGYSE